MLYAIVGMLVIIADQYIKFWVVQHVTLTASEPLIPGIVSLVNVHNDGAAFGFLAGSGARIPFIILAGVFTVLVIIALATNLISGKLARWSIVMVTAGGLSNCLDRVLYGYVQDMFKLEFINFPVFNLADIVITVFAILFALAVIFGKTHKDEDEEDFLEDEEEEEKPVSRRKQKRMDRKAKKQRREEEEDEEEEEEEEPIPAPKKARGRRGRKQAEEEEEELPAPKKASKKAAASSSKKAAAKAEEEEDPFAAWERANARVRAVKDRQSAVVQAAAKPAAKTAAPAREAPARPTAQTKSAAAPAAKPAAKPASTSKPAAKPAPKPAPKPVEEEFSLDDILNEFR